MKTKKAFCLFMIVFYYLLLLGGCADTHSSGDGSETAFNPDQAAGLAQALDDAVGSLKVMGAVMAVRDQQGNIWYGASGLADKKNG